MEDKKKSNEEIKVENSMNYGLGSCLILLLAVFKDFLNWNYGIEGRNINGVVGTVAIVLFFVILQCNLGEKIMKSEKGKNIIDICTFLSIILFVFENAVFDFLEEGNSRIVSIFLCALIVIILICLGGMRYKKK